MHDNAFPRRGTHRAGHLRPALGHIGTRVDTRIEPNLERVTRRHGGVELNGHLFVAHSDQAPHAHALVDCTLKAHKLGARTPSQVRIGKPTVKRPSQLAFERRHRIGIPRAVAQHIERVTPRPHHVKDIVGILHATLDLERRHAGGNKLGQVRNAQVITRAQQTVPPNGDDALPRLVH